MSKTTTGAAAKLRSERKLTPSAADVEKQITHTSDPIADQAGQYAAMNDARNRFIGVTIGLGWRMAITVIVPLFIGVKLDERFNSSPSYTLAAFFLAMGVSAVVVWDTIKDINAQQAKEDREKAGSTTNTDLTMKDKNV